MVPVTTRLFLIGSSRLGVLLFGRLFRLVVGSRFALKFNGAKDAGSLKGIRLSQSVRRQIHRGLDGSVDHHGAASKGK